MPSQQPLPWRIAECLGEPSRPNDVGEHEGHPDLLGSPPPLFDGPEAPVGGGGVDGCPQPLELVERGL